MKTAVGDEDEVRCSGWGGGGGGGGHASKFSDGTDSLREPRREESDLKGFF